MCGGADKAIGSQKASQSILLAQQPSHVTAQSSQSSTHLETQILNPIDEASTAVARCLLSRPDIHWALVGGASLVALGSNRQTEDVDIVVAPPNLLRDARSTLRQDRRFSIDPRTRHTYFNASNGTKVDIEFLSSPGTFRRPFTVNSPVQRTSSNIPCLPLPALLDSKCNSMPERTSQAKRRNDAADIVFLLLFLKSRSQKLSPSEVPSADREFQHWFEEETERPISMFRDVGL